MSAVKGSARQARSPNTMSKIRSVLTIGTSLEVGCPVCGQWLRGNCFDESVQHMLVEHDYVLLHVGAETHWDEKGKPRHSTVAVVGSSAL
ncbi:MAG TPA: hypothetical protein VFS55_01065 [Dokdonella sp.]|nr:hypothetical protein [Dokdonella sp.]